MCDPAVNTLCSVTYFCFQTPVEDPACLGSLMFFPCINVCFTGEEIGVHTFFGLLVTSGEGRGRLGVAECALLVFSGVP